MENIYTIKESLIYNTLYVQTVPQNIFIIFFFLFFFYFFFIFFVFCFFIFFVFFLSLRILINTSLLIFSKIFYWPFQGGTSFVDLLCFCSVLCLLCFVLVCLYVLCGHLLGKGWPLGSRLWCLLWVCHFPIGILGQVWYLIVSIPDLCTITYF